MPASRHEVPGRPLVPGRRDRRDRAVGVSLRAAHVFGGGDRGSRVRAVGDRGRS